MTITMSSAHFPSFPSLHIHHTLFSSSSVTLPTSQLILQPFRCFTYVTTHSPTLISLLLRHRLFTYVTWRAAHARRIRLPQYERDRFLGFNIKAKSCSELRSSGKLCLADVQIVPVKCTFPQELFIGGDRNFYKLIMKALTVFNTGIF